MFIVKSQKVHTKQNLKARDMTSILNRPEFTWESEILIRSQTTLTIFDANNGKMLKTCSYERLEKHI